MNIALLIAGGSGNRMGQSIPKQFLTVKKRSEILNSSCYIYEFNTFEDFCDFCNSINKNNSDTSNRNKLSKKDKDQ